MEKDLGNFDLLWFVIFNLSWFFIFDLRWFVIPAKAGIQ